MVAMPGDDAVTINRNNAAAIFAEWERRYRENPSQFMQDTERFSTGTDTYGGLCADMFFGLRQEVTR